MKKNAVDLINSNKKRAIPSFDIGGGNIDFIEAAFQAARNKEGVMFLSSTPSTITSYLGYGDYVRVINLLGEKYPSVDFAIHLDHATKIEDVMSAMDAEFSSVMYDGSHEQFEVNVENTKLLMKEAVKRNITVEGELGIIGGKEDEIDNDKSSLPTLTDIQNFLEQTNVDLMAPAVGTVHGNFKGEPKIDWDLIKGFMSINANFVLHGCTGLDNSHIKKAVDHGYKKLNFATTLRETFKSHLIDSLSDKRNLKPYTYLKDARAGLVAQMESIFDLLV